LRERWRRFRCSPYSPGGRGVAVSTARYRGSRTERTCHHSRWPGVDELARHHPSPPRRQHAPAGPDRQAQLERVQQPGVVRGALVRRGPAVRRVRRTDRPGAAAAGAAVPAQPGDNQPERRGHRRHLRRLGRAALGSPSWQRSTAALLLVEGLVGFTARGGSSPLERMGGAWRSGVFEGGVAVSRS
jgi:hypothetical protein